MSFLFPLFLAAGAAVLAPLLLHLRRQPPTKVTEFSSLLFLQPSPQVTTTKRRLEKWLLLLLRCLVLLLLAFMFARPYRSSEAALQAAGTGRAVVVLLDQSASMSRGGLWPEALERVQEAVANLTPQDRLCLATFDSEAHRRLDFQVLDAMGPAERAAQVKAALAAVKPTQRPTRFDKALMMAAAWLDETRRTTDETLPMPSSREIVLISDMQEGGSLGELNAFTWPSDVNVTLETLATEDLDNRSLALAAADESEAGSDGQAMLRLRITNAAEADAAGYSLTMDDDRTVITSGQIPAGATRILRAPQPRDDKPHTFKLADDDWNADNVVHVAPAQPRRLRIAVATARQDADDASGPLYYLKRALQPSRSLVPELQVVTDEKSLSSVQADWLIILLDGADDKLLQAAGRLLAQGGRGFALAFESTTADSLKRLTGHDLKIAEAKVKDYALLADLNTEDPALEPFRDSRLADLSRIHVWHHRSVSNLPPAAKTLMAFDDRSPALVELPVGKGSLHLMMTGWQPRDSQLAHSPHFIALLDGLMSRIGANRPHNHQFVVGDRHPMDPSKTLDQTGHLRIEAPSGPIQLAVNLASEESRLSSMDPSLLASFGIPLRGAGGSEAAQKEETVRLEHESLERRQQYWLLLLAALLWIVGLETWLAGRKSTASSEPAASA